MFVDRSTNHQPSEALAKDGLARGRDVACYVSTKGVYMNESGKFVAKELKKRGIKPDQLILVHDDLDLALGDFKLQKSRGHAGNKGVQSVINALGTKDFWRLRIGIGRPSDGSSPEDYVLKRFSKEEMRVLEEEFSKVLSKLQATF